MRRLFLTAALLVPLCLAVAGHFGLLTRTEQPTAVQQPTFREIRGEVERGETLFAIFKKHNLDIGELYRMREASAGTWSWAWAAYQ